MSISITTTKARHSTSSLNRNKIKKNSQLFNFDQEDQDEELKESELNMALEVRIPLFGRASDLKVTKEFTFNGASDVDGISMAIFQVKTDNGFPFSVDLQIHFLDINGNVLVTLIEEVDQRIVEAASVDGAGM